MSATVLCSLIDCWFDRGLVGLLVLASGHVPTPLPDGGCTDVPVQPLSIAGVPTTTDSKPSDTDRRNVLPVIATSFERSPVKNYNRPAETNE
ncbi:hypothetical protein CYV19_10505 [Natronobacterium gregoryi SP2]|uniref:Uncharacterized protein n=1 Tax=Natronobacterium gregoryi (strain ATCC 43098 / DSM 3393 / CCM 3738 / CIP 104747 / IAM 13177 / JCM 8860 / NBRC 102187 / NCIMB 2189 / SP2) TaxID=797304 RepID=L9YF34_NATGS|nr:hypothetical protein C490_02803 [Natronobacterium gregoryi SP2]PLK20253.1 hypothetical protein CYV19_10505 [Natronobacterium gregoryi SP2]